MEITCDSTAKQIYILFLILESPCNNAFLCRNVVHGQVSQTYIHIETEYFLQSVLCSGDYIETYAKERPTECTTFQISHLKQIT